MRRLPPFLLAFAAVASPAVAQPAQGEDEALTQDAAEYARVIGVSQDEAVRRMRLQAASVAVTDEIARTHASRLAGIAIEHRPDLRIRVRLTGDAPVAGRIVAAAGMEVPVTFETGATATREAIIAAIRRHRDGINAIIGNQGMGFDARTGTLVVMANASALGADTAEAVAARITALTGVPARIRLLDRPAENFSGVGGGGRVEGSNPGETARYFCTTGFVVTDGTRTGIVTAAHCPDSVTYTDAAGVQVPLEFAGGWGARFQDVQVHVGGGVQSPEFRAGPTPRRQSGRRPRASTRAGEIVCHRGEASGYSCAEVDLTDYAPPGDLCGGPCDATWVTVSGPTCRGGDSGGPVFVGTTALGILKGGNYAADGRCNFYYYMSTDYLPPGWSLLTEPADTDPADAGG